MVCAALIEHITDFIWFVCISCDMPQFQIFTFRHVLKNRRHQDVPSLYFVVENCSMHCWLGCSDKVTLFEVFFSFLIGTHISVQLSCELWAHSTMISNSKFSMHGHLISINSLLFCKRKHNPHSYIAWAVWHMNYLWVHLLFFFFAIAQLYNIVYTGHIFMASTDIYCRVQRSELDFWKMGSLFNWRRVKKSQFPQIIALRVMRKWYRW